MISRMKYINRWALMINERGENLCEHSFEVAIIAHALALIAGERFGAELNCERAALLGLYHDAPEILTGDMPTPVKYYSEETRKAYKTVEENAALRLLSMLPGEMRGEYASLFNPSGEDAELWKLVKAADKISALIKCIEEKKAGNVEFVRAGEEIRAAVEKMNLPAAEVFLKEFLPPYETTLDELKG